MSSSIRTCSKCHSRPVKAKQRWCAKCRTAKPLPATDMYPTDSALSASFAKNGTGRTPVNGVNTRSTQSGQSNVPTPAAYVPFVAGRPLHDEAWFDPFLSDLAVNGSPALAASAAGQHIDAIERHADQNAAFANEIDAASRYYRELLEWQSVNLARTKNNPLPFFARLKKELPAGYVEKNLTVNVNIDPAHDAAMANEAAAMLAKYRATATPFQTAQMRGAIVEVDATSEMIEFVARDPVTGAVLVRETTDVPSRPVRPAEPPSE